MVSRERDIHQPLPPSGDFRRFVGQTRQVIYMESEIGRTQPQQFRVHQQQQQQHLPFHALPHLHPHARRHLRPHSFRPPYPHDVQEAIQREIEKKKIREEIIMSEIMRRRVLEAEVRRELMLERELALRRGSDGFPIASSATMGLDLSKWVPLHMGPTADEKFLEERSMLSRLEREGLNGAAASAGSSALRFPPFMVSRPNEKFLEERTLLSRLAAASGGSATLPFQRGSREPRISEVQHVADGRKGKEKIILLAKPYENLSGSKRKAPTPPPGILTKKAKEEWSCALCQVSAISEQGLNQHLQGKKHKNKAAALRAQRGRKNFTIGLSPKKSIKHKNKEAALRAQRGGKNFTIGLFPKKSTKSIPVQETVYPDDVPKSSTSESVPSEETVKTTSLEKVNPEKLNSEISEKNLPVVVQMSQKNANLHNERPSSKLCCEICQVGVPSWKVMNSHTRGKKHIRRLAMQLNAGAGPSDRKGKLVITHMDDGGVAGDGENMASYDADVAVKEGGGLMDDETIDVVKPEGEEHVDKIEGEDGGAVDLAEPGDGLAKPDVADDMKDEDEHVKEGGLEDDKTMDSVKPKDDKHVDEIDGEDGEVMEMVVKTARMVMKLVAGWGKW